LPIKKHKKQDKFQGKQDSPQLETLMEQEITWDEAEKRIFEMIQSRKRYSEIVQVGFNITGTGFHRFSISEVSRIKTKFNLKRAEPEPPRNNQNEQIALVFELIEKGLDAIQIVTKTRLNPDFVQMCFQKRQKLQGYSKDLIDDIKQIMNMSKMQYSTEKELLDGIYDALESHYFLSRLKYRCFKCQEYIYLSPVINRDQFDSCMIEWRYIISYLSKNHCHEDCV